MMNLRTHRVLPPLAARFVGGVLAAGVLASGALAGAPPIGPQAGPVSVEGSAVRALSAKRLADPDLVVCDVSAETSAALRTREGAVVVSGLPVPSGLGVGSIDLEIERFRIIGPDTRFVVGRLDGPDVPLEFDPESVAMFRGRVAGHPNSNVFFSVSSSGVLGRIDLGPGEEKYLVSSRSGEGGRVGLRSGEAAVFRAEPGSGRGVGLSVPMCGGVFREPAVDAAATMAPGSDGAPAPNPAAPSPRPRGVDPIFGLRQLQLAVETDYELFILFGDLNATADYVTQLYGIISDIYIRDVNTRIDLSFVRLWDNPADLFNDAEPLVPFRNYWNMNMQAVTRDTAQFLTGRRDLSAGGVAYVSALCGNAGYSWAGYVVGYLVDPDEPFWSNRDIMVAGHEIGHNCGTLHTHDYNLDTCDDPLTQPQRGTIMAYCGQTFSGGDGNHDFWFHEVTAVEMRNHMYTRACIVFDCNQNGRSDSLDISMGSSVDVNANGVPDECEDCNHNGRLDSIDISIGFSLDSNANQVPDECEPDCDGDGIPNTREIALGAADANFNRIPDACEPDCDGDGVSDHLECSANMPLDIDRNVILDSCQDCDGDGVSDLRAIGHAGSVYVGSLAAEDAIREFHAVTGVLMDVHAAGTIAQVGDVLITPTGRILVASQAQSRVAEFTPSGAFIGNLVAPGAGGLNTPGTMLISPSKTLLVASQGTNQVLEFNLMTGAFIRVVVGPGSGSSALIQPFGLATGIDIGGALLYVTSADNRVLEYHLASGAFNREFVTLAGNGGMIGPRAMIHKPGGNLLVCSLETNQVLEFDRVSGAFVGQWNHGGTVDRLTLDEPWGIRLGPDGDVYVSRSHVHRSGPQGLHLTDARIYQFDIRNGNLVRAYILGNDTGLYRPTGFDFLPSAYGDCNGNRLPDSCDIASGTSLDANGDRIPDECTVPCRADFNLSGGVSSQDLFDFLQAWFVPSPAADINRSGAVTSQDIFDFLAMWFRGCN